jgi:hypothetical protein
MHFVIIIRFFRIFCWLRRLAYSTEDIVVHRTGVSPLARQNILPLTGSDDSEQFHCVVRKCHQSANHDGTRCKGSNTCSVSYNISPRRGQWAMANLSQQQNVMSCVRRGVDCRKKVSQYLSLILRKNSLLLVLECLLSTLCLHLGNHLIASRNTDLHCEMFVS